jgi:hypothetical protein
MKEVTVVYFNVITEYTRGGTDKVHKLTGRCSRSPADIAEYKTVNWQ